MAGFSNTIRAVLEMDVTPFQTSINRAVGLNQGMADKMAGTAKESAAAFMQLAKAQSDLSEARRAKIFAEAGKVKIRQRELVDLIRARNATEAGTVERMQAQLAIVQQLGRIRGQRMEARASVSAGGFGGDFAARGVSEGARRLAGDLEKSSSIIDKIRAKFTGGNILTSVLGGVGLGSGFAIAEKAAGLISSHWEKAAESAKAIAEYSGEATNVLLERINLRQTDAQRLETARRAEQSAATALARAGAVRDNGEAAARANVEWQKAALNLEKLEKEARERRKKAADKQAEEDKQRRDRELDRQIAANERQRDWLKEEAARKKEIDDAEKEANRVEKQYAESRMSAAQALKAAEMERDIIEEHLARTVEGTLVHFQTRKDLAEADLKVAQAREKLAEKEKQQAEATNKVLKSRADLADAARSRVDFTLDEAAGGSRGSSVDQRRARRIRRLEEQARRAYDETGGTTKDLEGLSTEELQRRVQDKRLTAEQAESIRRRRGRNLTGEERAAILEGRASDQREGFGRLNSSDRDPLKSHKEALAESEKLLGEIKKSLEPVESSKK